MPELRCSPSSSNSGCINLMDTPSLYNTCKFPKQGKHTFHLLLWGFLLTYMALKILLLLGLQTKFWNSRELMSLGHNFDSWNKWINFSQFLPLDTKIYSLVLGGSSCKMDQFFGVSWPETFLYVRPLSNPDSLPLSDTLALWVCTPDKVKDKGEMKTTF